MRLITAFLSAALLVAVVSWTSVDAAVQFTVSPHSARAAGKVSVRATHLSPHAQYVMVFVPTKNKKLERFLGIAIADGSGKFAQQFVLPPVPYCGSATVYLMSTKKTVAKTDIKVTGCNPKTSAPPPPPHR